MALLFADDVVARQRPVRLEGERHGGALANLFLSGRSGTSFVLGDRPAATPLLETFSLNPLSKNGRALFVELILLSVLPQPTQAG